MINEKLQAELDDANRSTLDDDVVQLTGEIEKIKYQNESTIRSLEQEWIRNEEKIKELKAKAADTEHEFQKT